VARTKRGSEDTGDTGDGIDVLKLATAVAALVAALTSGLNYLDAQGWFPPPPKTPDLVLGASASGDFCTVDGGRLVLTVKNIGEGDADSESEAEIVMGQDVDGPPTVVSSELVRAWRPVRQ
jgi:hypothetical protein